MAAVDQVVVASALTPPTFTAITLGPGERLTQTDGVPDNNDPVTLRFEGLELRPALMALSHHQARRISGGQPRSNLSGFRCAVADLGAELVRVTWMEGVPRAVSGVFSIVSAQVGPGGHLRQSFVLVIYPCNRLRWYGVAGMQTI